MANELLSQSRKLNKRGDPNKSGVVEKFFEKKKTSGGRGTLIGNPRVD